MNTIIIDADDSGGYVKLVDFFGGDEVTANIARTCYQSEAKTANANKNLIKKLISNGHTSVFEHSVFRFEVHCPIFIARQWMRHRMGSYTEMSMRHVQPKRTDFWHPEGPHKDFVIRVTGAAWDIYKSLIDDGMPVEEARAVLPVAVYTTFTWTVNARSLMNYLDQRTAPEAQSLHREYAQRVLMLFGDVMPITHDAWLAKSMTVSEAKMIKDLDGNKIS